MRSTAIGWIVALAATTARADFEYSGFNGAPGLSVVGLAAQDSGVLRLTNNSNWQLGAAWRTEPQSVLHGFSSTFTFRIHTLTQCGADGFAFVIHDAGPQAIGGAGFGIGYGATHFCGSSNVPTAVAIEFDTVHNVSEVLCDPATQQMTLSVAVNDPDANHVSIQAVAQGSSLPGFASATANSIALGTAPFNLSDSLPHTARIEYDGAILSVFLDGGVQPVVSAAVDLGGLTAATDGMAWVGFTSSTGDCGEFHDILDWSFASDSFHWTDLDGGIAGASGVPILSGTGTPFAGIPVGLALANAKPSGAAFLIAGDQFSGLPLLSGILVPQPDLVVGALPIDSSGGLAFAGPWPPGVPPSSKLYFQYWIPDAAAPLGVAASNGLEAITPGP